MPPNAQPELKRLDFKLEFNHALLAYERLRAHKSVVLCGDLNVAHKEIDLANPKANVKIQGFPHRNAPGWTPLSTPATSTPSANSIRSRTSTTGAMDLGIAYSEVPADAVGYTSNKVKSAPVQIMMKENSPKLSAVAINSGNANALTGAAAWRTP